MVRHGRFHSARVNVSVTGAFCELHRGGNGAVRSHVLTWVSVRYRRLLALGYVFIFREQLPLARWRSGAIAISLP